MMQVLRSIIRAYRRGGLGEVVLASRRRLAHWVSSDARTAVEAGRSPHPQPPAISPLTVEYDQALRWFDARRNAYEAMAIAIEPYLPADAMVLDVGANVGYFTKILTEVASFRGRAELFEPVPHLADLCRRTARNLRCTARVHEFALGEVNGSEQILVSSGANLGWNTLVTGKAAPDMTPVRIEVRRYDGAGIRGTPALIKIDVEGAEYQVLNGMMSALTSWSPRPVILCEVGWGQSHPAWDAELKAFGQLQAIGYRICSLAGEPIDITSIRQTTDVLFMPTGTR